MIVSSDDHKMEQILCEHDALYAIDNILNSNCSNSAIFYALRSLERIIIVSPEENTQSKNFWSFSKEKIKATLQSYEIQKII